MDERGSGIRRMREAMTRQGLDVPRFALVEDEFTATLSGHRTETVERPERAPRHQDPLLHEPVTDRQKQILRQVLEAGFVTSAACVQALGIAKDTAWRDLNDLIAQGYVRITGAGRASRYVAAPRLQAILLSEGQTQIGRKSDESPSRQTQIGRKPSAPGAKGTKSGGKADG
jgi:predicted HTH transcriptional regulator